MSSWTGGTGGGSTRKINTFLMSEDRWQRALKEHNHRINHVKPAVDLKSPWGCSRPYVPLPPHGGDQVDSARSASGSRAQNRPTSASSSARRPGSATSARGGGGGGGSRPTSAVSRNGRPTSAMSRASTTTTNANHASGAQIISHLPLQQQRLCEEMIKLLTGLDKEQSKTVLEHLYSSAEESRLLQSYSGVYPGLLVNHNNTGNNSDDEENFQTATAADDDHK
jgi:hypothetical protein